MKNVKTLQGYKLDSLEGEFGEVKDFYFDDQHWTIRYLVADTGNWLPGRLVLISPHALITMDKEERQIDVNLTRQQIEESPLPATDKPVSRQFEETYFHYHGWPRYWDGSNVWGMHPATAILNEPEAQREREPGEKARDPNLRSTQTVTDYYIEAEDGAIGHVEDFIIDDETWAIRYLVVDTKNWWPGKRVLISPRWIERVSWNESKVFVRLSREAFKQAPEYTAESLLTRDYESRLHGHYSRKGYWVDEPVVHEPSTPKQIFKD